MSNIDIKIVSKNFSAAANTYNYWAEPQREIAKTLVEKLVSIRQIPDNILDLGCGTGYVIEQALKHGVQGRILGVDIAEGMISYCMDKWKSSPNISFIQDDINQYKSDIPFDLITSSCALQWMVQIKETFDRMFSNLNHNGCIALAILIEGSFCELLESYKKYFNYALHGIDYKTSSFFKNIFIENNIKILIDDIMTVYSYQYGTEMLKYFKNIGATFRLNRNYAPLSVRDVNKLIDIYRQDFGGDGMLPISHKVLYLIGEKI